MQERCPYHEDLVKSIARLCTKVDVIMEDVKGIKTDLYVANNGGLKGYVYKAKGATKAMTFVIPIAFSAITTFAVLMLQHVLK